MVSMPNVVSAKEWQNERDALLAAEKEATRRLDAIAAQRRRLPMIRFDNEKYLFETTEGPKRLLDFFDGRQQLAVYQFMDNGPDAFCPGCTHFTTNVSDLPTLAEEGVSWRTVSNMPIAQMQSYWDSKGWTVPFASSRERPLPMTAGPTAVSRSTCSSRTASRSIARTRPTVEVSTDCCSSTTSSTSPPTVVKRIGRTRPQAGLSILPTDETDKK